MNRSGSGSCTQPERDRGKISIEQEPGRPDSPVPKTLESGRTHRLKKATTRLPENLHRWKLPFQPGGKQDLASRDLGSREKKTERFSILMLSEE